MSNGYYISFEGPEACGKTTQIKLLDSKLKHLNVDVVLSKEPGSTHSKVCQAIRQVIFYESIVENAAFFSFLADRSQHMNEVIIPALNQNKVVLSDRGTLSTLVYHLARLGPSPSNWSHVLNLLPALDYAQTNHKPDLCFIASADYEWSVQQLALRAGIDRIEQLGKTFHLTIHELFNTFAYQNTQYSHFVNQVLLKLHSVPNKIVALPSASRHTVEEIHQFIMDTVAQELPGVKL